MTIALIVVVVLLVLLVGWAVVTYNGHAGWSPAGPRSRRQWYAG